MNQSVSGLWDSPVDNPGDLGPDFALNSVLLVSAFTQVVINPNYEVSESDYTNNIMKCRCRYDGNRVWMYNCHNGKKPVKRSASEVSLQCHEIF